MAAKEKEGTRPERMLGIFRRNREMDCAEVRKLGSSYLDEDLPASRLDRLQTHLAKCGPCQAFVSSLASVIGSLTRLPRMRSPDGLRQSILDGVRQEKEKSDKVR